MSNQNLEFISSNQETLTDIKILVTVFATVFVAELGVWGVVERITGLSMRLASMVWQLYKKTYIGE
jgi:putative Ca2+/H+ antiporter (TMEM165/GDT1 family)